MVDSDCTKPTPSTLRSEPGREVEHDPQNGGSVLKQVFLGGETPNNSLSLLKTNIGGVCGIPLLRFYVLQSTKQQHQRMFDIIFGIFFIDFPAIATPSTFSHKFIWLSYQLTCLVPNDESTFVIYLFEIILVMLHSDQTILSGASIQYN